MTGVVTRIGYFAIGIVLLFAIAALNVWIREALKPKGRDTDLR